MARIFISYRRSDTQMVAGRLRDALMHHFGEEAVFRDKSSIKAGEDWIAAIEAVLTENVSVLVLIGQDWATAKGDDGELRLHDPTDWVRLEIEQAFARSARILPVLVDGAKMPDPASLPESLKLLTRIHALKLRDDDWEPDLKALITSIRGRGRHIRSRDLILAAVATITVAGAAYGYYRSHPAFSFGLPNVVSSPAATTQERRPAGTPRDIKLASGLDCSHEKDLYSRGTHDSTSIVFVNIAPHPRRIYWIDHAGHRQLYKELLPGMSFGVTTYSTHTWIVATVSDKCLGIFVPTVEPLKVHIDS